MINKNYLGIVVALVLVGGGYYAGYKRGSTPQTITKTAEVKHVETDTHTVEKGVMIVTRPDGAKETRIESRETVKDQTVTKHLDTSVEVRPPRLWSAGIYTNVIPKSDSRSLMITLDRHVLENVSLGIYGRYSEGGQLEAGAGLRLDF